MAEAVRDLMKRCGGYPNFVPSSGCDLPPVCSWENIRAFFESVNQYYTEN
jgi:uroporphyrinogen decarboxylase